MSFPNDQFFLDRFVAFNQDRYQDEPSFVASLGSLTLGEVVFTNRRKNSKEDGTPFYLVDMNASRVFKAFDQEYTPGDVVVSKALSLVDEDPVASDVIAQRFVPGFYLLQGENNTTSGVVLVKHGELNAPNILALIKAGTLYALEDTDITLSTDLLTATIDSHTLIGTLSVIESSNVDGAAYYDGTYLYDGTITY